MTCPSELRAGLPPLPNHMKDLPRDSRGYPVPWFVAWVDGVPDFRVADGAKRVKAVKHNLCWICGQRLGTYLAFTIGPMCAINRVSSDPPQHLECAIFSALGCPFLSRPQANRRTANLPAEAEDAPGLPIMRNPGVTLVWVTKSYRIRSNLFYVGDPVSTAWYREGRAATRQEVLDSIQSGLPSLTEMAAAEGPTAVQALEYATAVAMRLVPAA